MSKWGWATRIGGFAAAPFTFGLSIPASNIAANAIERKQASNDGPGGSSGGKNPEDAVSAMLQQSSQNLRGIGTDLSSQGTDALGPVLTYLKGVLGDNPSAVMDATRPERARVIDQYDTARKAISQFGPRGGGLTSSLAESNISEGETLAGITSAARKDAAGQAASLGTTLTGLGLSAQQLASMDLSEVIKAVLAREGFDVAKRGQNMEALAGIGEAVGTVLAAKYGNA